MKFGPNRKGHQDDLGHPKAPRPVFIGPGEEDPQQVESQKKKKKVPARRMEPAEHPPERHLSVQLFRGSKRLAESGNIVNQEKSPR